MHTKWLIVWLIGLFLLVAVSGYLFVSYRSEKQIAELIKEAPSITPEYIKEQALAQGFDYSKDKIAATVLKKTKDEDDNPALQLYFSWPPGSPLYDKNATVSVSCSANLSNLVFTYPPKSEGERLREETNERGIDVYAIAEKACIPSYNQGAYATFCELLFTV